METSSYRWPLMADNVTLADRQAASRFFLSNDKLTHGPQVQAFEEEFAAWLGVKYAVMVNSGSSANLLTMYALKLAYGCRTVAVPVITWGSDIAAILHTGLEPVFVDVDPYTLGMDYSSCHSLIEVVFPTHCLGFNALPAGYPGTVNTGAFILIEDCCEALGATCKRGHKLGTFGLMSNFSFYYSHHLTTIEGGMICTDDGDLYQLLRRLRSHGLTREMTDEASKRRIADFHPDLDPNFTFMEPAWNVRPIEVQAVIGREQLKRLDENNEKRRANLQMFLSTLDPQMYRTQYRTNGCSSFALPLVLRQSNSGLMDSVLACLRENGVEYRRGTAGGGNQLRQPYAKARWGTNYYKQFPQAEHLHQFGLFVGNYPTLDPALIVEICGKLNRLNKGDSHTTFHHPV